MKLPEFKKYPTGLLAILLVLAAATSQMTLAALEYEQRYHALLSELRCLVCQNQTIAESDAELAKDLRAEVKKMLAQGATDAEIIEFMANRYGDFVLYKPLVKPKTYVLWFGPFAFLIIVVFILVKIINRQKKTRTKQLSKEEQTRLNTLLDKD